MAVREQAAQLATAWSGADTPASWRLTGALFATLRDDPDLLAIAARIDPDRLPALLFVAAVVALLEAQRPEPLARVLPVPGEEQPPLPPDFAAELRAFCLERADELLALAASHRYQMSEPARCAHLLPAVAAVAADAGRPLALVDIGTGAGFALHLDAYRYSYDRDDGEPLVVGAADAPVTLHTALRGPHTPPIPAFPPAVAVRIGVDTEPLDVGDPSVRAWLRACTPPVAEALLRFDRAADHAAAHPVTTVRADALRALPEVIEGLREDVHPCVLDAYVNVFFTDEGQARFRDEMADLGGAATSTGSPWIRSCRWATGPAVACSGRRSRPGCSSAPAPKACSASWSASRTGGAAPTATCSPSDTPAGRGWSGSRRGAARREPRRPGHLLVDVVGGLERADRLQVGVRGRDVGAPLRLGHPAVLRRDGPIGVVGHVDRHVLEVAANVRSLTAL